MTHPPTILVLTPSLGGHYFGEVLAGLACEIASAGGRLVLVQTLEPGAASDEIGLPGDFATPVAWAEIDGVVSITSAVHGSFLHKLRAAGKPVVLASTRITDFQTPLALPDNLNGTIAAVEHLIAHGHTRIGFVGNLTQHDVRDRYQGYLDALDRHHLAADPAFVFTADDNAQLGGQQAARALLAGRDRPTALMVATDRNAIGLMRTVAAAGVTVPTDLAIVAFDNTEAAAFTTPTLSSVNQRFDELGALAGRLVLAALRGETVANTAHTLPSALVAIRSSCGCSTDALDPESDTDTSPETLRANLETALSRALMTGHGAVHEPMREAVRAVVREAEVLLDLGEAVTAAQLRTLTASLRRLTTRPEVLRRIAGAMVEYVQATATRSSRLTSAGLRETGAAATDIVGPARVAGELWRLQSGAFLEQAEATENVLDEQFVVDAGLLDTDRSDPRHLGWLAGTHVRAGVLALWDGEPSAGRLRIVGTYDPEGILPRAVDTVLAPENFPPSALVTAVRPAERGVCVVVPVRTKERNWGLLSVVGEIDTTSARETYHHWAALLCASLESENLQERVRRSAFYDSLTGLPNRRMFLERLDTAVALWHRSKTPFAVLFLDLDGFKLITDSLGHEMGDRVLTAIGARVEGALREVDTGARFGGDEFAILLHDVEDVDVIVVAHRVLSALADVIELDGHEFSIGASLGVATSAIAYRSAEDVLRDADTAMYHAKSSEPGSVSFFDAAMHARAVGELRLQAEIRHALDEHQFEVHYQPIVDLTTGRTDRFEALVRWNHPERGMLPPDEFLPLMGQTGLIVRLGHWILDEVCRQLAAWGPRVANVAVNVSDREFWHSGLLAHVLASLDRHGLSPDRLTLEITEGVVMRRPEVALALMREMHDAGLQLHIDDFGTGQSSLQMLHRFPVDAFKIDRSFIHGLTSGDHTDELVRAIVVMGKALGLAVVAEGVETTEQLEFLREIGCATGQGFLFTPAVTSDRAADLIDLTLGRSAST